MSSASFGGVAGGDIFPCRFTKLGTTAGVLLQATAGDQINGISSSGTHTANMAGLDDGKCAVAGENVKTYREPGQIWQVQSGAAFAVGVRLKSDANGKGIAVAAAGDQYGAVALEACGAADLFVPVRIEFGIW